ncbi:MAG: TlpA family protein disulfide reductase [Bacteroidales bacterium]|nr:TlpA family protein disulfide reductase [Bacteroidales bacterium]
MKRIMIMALAALTALSACKQQSSEEMLQGFTDLYQEEVNHMQEAFREMATDANRSEEEVADAVAEIEAEMKDRLLAAADKIVRKAPNDTVVIPGVMRYLASVVDPEDMAGLADKIGADALQVPYVARLVTRINSSKATAVGSKFVDFTVDHVASVDKDGNPVYEKRSLSDYVGKGKVMLVDFWSPWCPPCKEEIPNIKNVWEKYHGDDFDVLSVAVWEESRGMTWRNTIDTAAFFGMNWQLLNNGHSEPTDLYGITGIPTLILFDKDGTILQRGEALRGSAMAPAVAAALGR